MFRTRDFVLFFTTIVFLASAIGVTLIKQSGTEARHGVFVPPTSEEITDVDVELVSSGEVSLDRESQIERLKRKIAESGVVSYSAPEVVEEVSEEKEVDVEVVERSVQYCSTHAAGVVVDWDPSTIEIVAVEGVRQYFTKETIEIASTTASTSDFIVNKNIRLELPIKFAPLGSSYCLSSDIVGVSLGGTLIRNTDVGLYSLFSSNTLIGYALDGFPIYGKGVGQLDSCGGLVVNGQYRYQLDENSDHIISCYADRPQQL